MTPHRNQRTIRIKNTLSGMTEDFVARDESTKTVTMYHCGPTVYQRAHVGNLRAYVLADTIRRTFEASGYSVKQVINITDVGHLTDDGSDGDDKMEREAGKVGKRAEDIALEFTKLFKDDIKLMNVRATGTLFPTATGHIKEQIDMIEELEKKGFAYKTSDGVYFDTSKFEGYGKLGNIDIEGQMAGARVAENDEKRNPTDFALWKLSPRGLDASAPARQQEWESPWGIGFPGWHIECSAMSKKYLGDTLDIHTGGIDHIPVHHNDEIAQSESVTGKQFVRYWMHGNFITIDNQKVSKSLGNTLSLDDLKVWGVTPLGYRYWLLTAHYSSQVNLTKDAVVGAQAAYDRLVKIARALKKPSFFANLFKKKSQYESNILAAVQNTFDTPKAIALIWEMTKDASVSDGDKRSALMLADTLLGLNLFGNDDCGCDDIADMLVPEEVAKLLTAREEARNRKDWAESDRLRAEIESKGYTVQDGPEGSVARSIARKA